MIDQFLKLENNLYQVLEVEEQCTRKQIKQAYKAMARLYHPDRLHQLPPSKQKANKLHFQSIKQAYDILHDSDTRAAYDSFLRRGNAVHAYQPNAQQNAFGEKLDRQQAEAQSKKEENIQNILNRQKQRQAEVERIKEEARRESVRREQEMAGQQIKKEEILQQLCKVVVSWDEDNSRKHYYSAGLVKLILGNMVLRAEQQEGARVVVEIKTVKETEQVVKGFKDECLRVEYQVKGEKRSRLEEWLGRLETGHKQEEVPLTIDSQSLNTINRLFNAPDQQKYLKKHNQARQQAMAKIIEEELGRE